VEKSEDEKTTATEETPVSKKLLTGKQTFAVLLVILGAIVTGGINVGVREYYQPDVRYEEGTWYYSGDKAVTSLRIRNYGAADAENIKFTAAFDGSIRNASVSDAAIEFSYDNQEDLKATTCRIDRLVPKQTAVVYFEVSLAARSVRLPNTFVRSIVYNGGSGKTGEPFWIGIVLIVISLGVAGVFFAFVLKAMRRYEQLLREDAAQDLHEHFTEALVDKFDELGIEFRSRRGPDN